MVASLSWWHTSLILTNMKTYRLCGDEVCTSPLPPQPYTCSLQRWAASKQMFSLLQRVSLSKVLMVILQVLNMNICCFISVWLKTGSCWSALTIRTSYCMQTQITDFYVQANPWRWNADAVEPERHLFSRGGHQVHGEMIVFCLSDAEALCLTCCHQSTSCLLAAVICSAALLFLTSSLVLYFCTHSSSNFYSAVCCWEVINLSWKYWTYTSAHLCVLKKEALLYK